VETAVGGLWIKAETILIAQLFGDEVEALFEIRNVTAIKTAGRFF